MSTGEDARRSIGRSQEHRRRMSFLENIFTQLEAARNPLVLRELHPDGGTLVISGRELLDLVGKARALLASKKLNKGERCALLGHNSIAWIAMDLAIMAEGLIVVPLYARQAAAELVAMMKDCSPALICCGDAALRDGIVESWPDAPPQFLCNDIFASSTAGITTNSRPTD